MMRQHRDVRTTLEIDDDILDAARELSRARNQSVGAVISTLAEPVCARRARTSSMDCR